VLGPFLEGLSDRQAGQLWLVATLFGSHPLSTRQGNLGTTLAQLREIRGPLPSLEKRLLALLATHVDDLGPPLRQVVGLARSSQVPINWAQLLADLRGWERHEGGVQMAWAREFWREGPPVRLTVETGEEETDILAEEPDDLPALYEPN
jgi:CRISPR system Cascade subunit CasB